MHNIECIWFYEQLVTVITVYGMGKNLNSQLPEMFWQVQFLKMGEPYHIHIVWRLYLFPTLGGMLWHKDGKVSLSLFPPTPFPILHRQFCCGTAQKRIIQQGRQRSSLLVWGRTKMKPFTFKDDLRKSFWENIHFGSVVIWGGVNQIIKSNLSKHPLG